MSASSLILSSMCNILPKLFTHWYAISCTYLLSWEEYSSLVKIVCMEKKAGKQATPEILFTTQIQGKTYWGKAPYISALELSKLLSSNMLGSSSQQLTFLQMY